MGLDTFVYNSPLIQYAGGAEARFGQVADGSSLKANVFHLLSLE